MLDYVKNEIELRSIRSKMDDILNTKSLDAATADIRVLLDSLEDHQIYQYVRELFHAGDARNDRLILDIVLAPYLEKLNKTGDPDALYLIMAGIQFHDSKYIDFNNIKNSRQEPLFDYFFNLNIMHVLFDNLYNACEERNSTVPELTHEDNAVAINDVYLSLYYNAKSLWRDYIGDDHQKGYLYLAGLDEFISKWNQTQLDSLYAYTDEKHESYSFLIQKQEESELFKKHKFLSSLDIPANKIVKSLAVPEINIDTELQIGTLK